jgi:hypothetical protein
VAESDGLENRCGCTPTVGSNPTPSAYFLQSLFARRVFVAPAVNWALLELPAYVDERADRVHREHGLGVGDW